MPILELKLAFSKNEKNIFKKKKHFKWMKNKQNKKLAQKMN
jgi:hypothetical protein